MPKIIERWLLFKYVDGQVTPQSKPFKTKAAAEKARFKLPERERRSVAVGALWQPLFLQREVAGQSRAGV